MPTAHDFLTDSEWSGEERRGSGSSWQQERNKTEWSSSRSSLTLARRQVPAAVKHSAPESSGWRLRDRRQGLHHRQWAHYGKLSRCLIDSSRQPAASSRQQSGQAGSQNAQRKIIIIVAAGFCLGKGCVNKNAQGVGEFTLLPTAATTTSQTTAATMPATTTYQTFNKHIKPQNEDIAGPPNKSFAL